MRIRCQNWRKQYEIGEFVLESGFYESEAALAKTLSEKVTELLNTKERDCKVQFNFDDNTRKIKLNIRCGPSIALYMSEALALKLGFKHEKNVCSNATYLDGSYEADEIFDINATLHLIYVYCDITSYVPVGDIKTPLLRVCNFTGNRGDTVRSTFTHPHYHPVTRGEFDTITININNELGLPFPFLYGKSLITLHFRRKHSLLPAS